MPTVSLSDSGCHPPRLRVRVGSSLEFKVVGTLNHLIRADNHALSPLLRPGDAWELTGLDRRAVVCYRCEIVSFIRGEIEVVEPTPSPPQPTEEQRSSPLSSAPQPSCLVPHMPEEAAAQDIVGASSDNSCCNKESQAGSTCSPVTEHRPGCSIAEEAPEFDPQPADNHIEPIKAASYRRKSRSGLSVEDLTGMYASLKANLGSKTDPEQSAGLKRPVVAAMYCDEEPSDDSAYSDDERVDHMRMKHKLESERRMLNSQAGIHEPLSRHDPTLSWSRRPCTSFDGSSPTRSAQREPPQILIISPCGAEASTELPHKLESCSEGHRPKTFRHTDRFQYAEIATAHSCASDSLPEPATSPLQTTKHGAEIKRTSRVSQSSGGWKACDVIASDVPSQSGAGKDTLICELEHPLIAPVAGPTTGGVTSSEVLTTDATRSGAIARPTSGTRRDRSRPGSAERRAEGLPLPPSMLSAKSSSRALRSSCSCSILSPRRTSRPQQLPKSTSLASLGGVSVRNQPLPGHASASITTLSAGATVAGMIHPRMLREALTVSHTDAATRGSEHAHRLSAPALPPIGCAWRGEKGSGQKLPQMSSMLDLALPLSPLDPLGQMT